MRKPVQLIIVAALLAAFLSWGPEALAAPSNINFQGRLTDPDGNAVPDAGYQMTFRIYSAREGGTLLWSEDTSVRVRDGMYTTMLGGVTPLTPGLFSTDLRWLEVWVNGEQLTPRQRLRSVGYAMNAHTLDGIEASGFATSTALEGKADTVHSHSGEQITAGTVAEPRIDPLIARQSALTTGLAGKADSVHAHAGEQITTGTVAEPRIDPAIARKAAVDDQIAALQSALTSLQSTVTSLQSTVESQQAKISELTSLLAGATRDGNTLLFTGMNLQIVSGSEATDGAINGLGNLIVGYNELRGFGDVRTGSHNLIVGKNQNYSNYGGIVGGFFNSLTNSYASVIGGYMNTAGGFASSVSGGYLNTANGSSSSVNGGSANIADGAGSSVGGGNYNTSGGMYSSVGGGSFNTANAESTSISGGNFNTANAPNSSVSGGWAGIAGGMYSSISGGQSNTAFGEGASVSGGLSRTAGSDQSWAAGTYFSGP